MGRGTVAVAASVAPVGDIEATALNLALHGALRAGLAMADAVHAARATLDPEEPMMFVNRCATTAFGGG
jgi:hypothetical protein